MRTMRRTLIAIKVLLAGVLVAGCSSAPVAPPPERGSASVTIVGWSLREQAPLPIRGVLRGDGAPISFDTKVRPEGKTLESIAPGRYRVEVTHRWNEDGREVPAAGLEAFDVRVGERVRCEVAIDDRGDGTPLPENAR